MKQGTAKVMETYACNDLLYVIGILQVYTEQLQQIPSVMLWSRIQYMWFLEPETNVEDFLIGNGYALVVFLPV